MSFKQFFKEKRDYVGEKRSINSPGKTKIYKYPSKFKSKQETWLCNYSTGCGLVKFQVIYVSS